MAEPKPRIGLVLGAGGVVGMAYHVGVLEAMVDLGVDLDAFDLIVGTSAGSVIGAELRAGNSLAEIRERTLDTSGVEGFESRTDIFSRSWTSPHALARRLVGSAYVMGRSVVRAPGPRMPTLLRRVFPAGLMAPALDPDAMDALLPAAWPKDPLWLCAVDIDSGRRTVLGRPGGVDADLREAVIASCAIPVVYQPVRVDGVTLVDGGVRSTTNLDLAAEFGCDLIIVVAPMAYDRQSPPGPCGKLIRRPASAAIARELVLARGHGSAVLLLRPTARELRLHGLNPMRLADNEPVADAAREAARVHLQSPRFLRLLRRFGLLG